jgi:hypothetical protein
MDLIAGNANLRERADGPTSRPKTAPGGGWLVSESAPHWRRLLRRCGNLMLEVVPAGRVCSALFLVQLF